MLPTTDPNVPSLLRLIRGASYDRSVNKSSLSDRFFVCGDEVVPGVLVQAALFGKNGWVLYGRGSISCGAVYVYIEGDTYLRSKDD